jgi:NitT/TauT family transport system permease protein
MRVIKETRRFKHGTGSFLLSLAVLILIWAVAAELAESRVLPGPFAVAQVAWAELRSGALAFHVAMTLLRVFAAFILAMAIGTAVGILLGREPSLNRFFDSWLLLALNIPALIVFCYLWIGINEVAAIAAVAINKIPNVAITMREGARALDPALSDVATVYRFPPMKRLRHIVWPQLEPFLAASVRSGLALIWKIVLVVELLGRNNGVGFQINLYFQLFDMARIFAYTLAFMAVVGLIEWLLIKPWEARARAWRGGA